MAIPEYDLFRWDRNENSGKFSGGGLVIYTSTKYNFSHVETSNICNQSIETMWTKITLPNSHPTYICAFYRPPDGSITDFIANLDNQLNNIIDNPAGDIIMCGDANIDFDSNNRDTKKLKEFLKQHN